MSRFATVSTIMPFTAPLAPLFLPASLSPMIAAAIFPNMSQPF
jgi:hypothetical protein